MVAGIISASLVGSVRCDAAGGRSFYYGYSYTMALADFGLIGLAVMGENLALNIESRGYTIAVFNRTTSVVDDLIKGRAAGKKVYRLSLARRTRQKHRSPSQGHDYGQGWQARR